MEISMLIYVQLLLNFVVIIETAEPCPTVDQLPVVNICAKDTKFQDASNTVLIKADSIQNCTCELSILNQDQAVTVDFQKFGQEISSSPTQYGCGLILHFGDYVFYFEDDVFWIADCVIDNTIISRTINQGKAITIRSWTVTGNLKQNEGYCIEIRNTITTGNKLNLTCGIDSTTTTTTTQSVETTTKTPTTNPLQLTTVTTGTITTTVTTKSIVPAATTTTTTTTTTVPATTTTTTVPATTTTATVTAITLASTTPIGINDEFTVANSTSTDGSVSTKQANQLRIEENDETTTLAAGASVGGFVIIIVVIGMVCIYRRNHIKSTSKPGSAVNTANDDYGLRDNVLYVSSEPSDTTQTQNNADSPKTNRISVDIDGNYSTVDLDEIPSVEESTGDYSSIDLEKLTPSKSSLNGSTNEKPTIAPKPKQKVTIQDDVYSVPDKKRVKHGTAPSEHACEYAVVRKSSNSNFELKSKDQPSTSKVYTVVEKKKRMSDGKGTNQKRDSLKADNNEETGQS